MALKGTNCSNPNWTNQIRHPINITHIRFTLFKTIIIGINHHINKYVTPTSDQSTIKTVFPLRKRITESKKDKHGILPIKSTITRRILPTTFAINTPLFKTLNLMFVSIS